MSNQFFEVKPLKSYDEARYPSASEDEELTEERPHPVVIMWAVLVVLLIGLGGLAGCYMRSEYTPETPTPDGGGGDGDADGDADGDGDADPTCVEGDVRCVDPATVEECEDEGWVAQDCEEFCDENYGIDAYSTGCDADAAEPCQCQYDIIDGDYDPCYPDGLYCVDERRIVICDEGWEPQDCDDYCVENFGHEYYSLGCDASAEDPCQCAYGMDDGMMAECLPEHVYCIDDETVSLCEDGIMTPHSCSDWCVETHGVDSASDGCVGTVDDPCSCIPTEP